LAHHQHQRNLSRRDFLRRAAVAVGAAGLGLGLRSSHTAAKAGQEASPCPTDQATLTRRPLGRTGLEVSQLGMGTSIALTVAVIQRAFDLGVNYFDTCQCYEEGNSEILLGKALQARRDRAILATKWHTDGHTPAAELLASLDGSLKRLGTDHVELIQIHQPDSLAQVNSDEVWEAFAKARQAGKVRFNGLSLHENQVELMRAAVHTGRFDAMLVPYNTLTADRVGPLLEEAHAAGVAVATMKSLQPVHAAKESHRLQDFPGNPYQRAIQWVLKHAHVSAVMVEMPSFDELEEDIAAASHTPSDADLEAFEKAVVSVSSGLCRLCGACTRQCPAGVKVADIMRYLLYHDGYGHRARAVSLYRRLPPGTSAAACAACQQCKAVCPWGVPVRERLRNAHSLLA
jgi:hypothetical protein